jgi:hypothetical protein
MRTFSTVRPARTLDRSAAWGCLVANVFVLPGLGTVTAGRRIGYLQGALALIGFGMTASWCVWFLGRWMHSGAVPDQVGPYFPICLAGMVLFALAWTWALMSSLRILARASASLPPRVDQAS